MTVSEAVIRDRLVSVRTSSDVTEMTQKLDQDSAERRGG